MEIRIIKDCERDKQTRTGQIKKNSTLKLIIILRRDIRFEDKAKNECVNKFSVLSIHVRPLRVQYLYLLCDISERKIIAVSLNRDFCL